MQLLPDKYLPYWDTHLLTRGRFVQKIIYTKHSFLCRPTKIRAGSPLSPTLLIPNLSTHRLSAASTKGKDKNVNGKKGLIGTFPLQGKN